MRIPTGMGVALALALSLVATSGRADNVADAKAHYKHGTAAYALGKYSEAATEYEAAFELAPDPALLYNAAQAQRLAGNKPRALMLYSSYLRLYGEEANTEEVRRRIDELKHAIEADGQPKSPPPPLVTPPPATVTTSPAEPAPSAVVARRRPLAKSPWLWVGIGAGVIVVAGVAIGLGIAFGRSDPKGTFGVVTY